MIFNLDYTWLADPTYQNWLREGIYNTIALSVICIACSLAIGWVGVWAQESPFRWVKSGLQVYIQIFRNTPPLVQMWFVYFVLSEFLPKVHDPASGGLTPILDGFASAAIMLSLFAGAFNIEIFRSGVDAVPQTMFEAGESLGYSRMQCFFKIVFPLALRVCLPALSSNLINLIKTTTLASAITTPELFFHAKQLAGGDVNAVEVMILIWVVYVTLTGWLAIASGWLERKLKIPGYGT